MSSATTIPMTSPWDFTGTWRTCLSIMSRTASATEVSGSMAARSRDATSTAQTVSGSPVCQAEVRHLQ